MNLRGVLRPGFFLIVLALVLGSLLVRHVAYAALSDSTTSPGNRLATGKVVLSDDRSGTALFSVPDLLPFQTGQSCIDVTYSGDLAVRVRLSAGYGPGDPVSALAQHLTFGIDQIPAGAACDASAPVIRSVRALDTTLKDKVDGMRADPADLTWTNTGSIAETRRYRFSYQLQGDNSAVGTTAEVGFTWTAETFYAVTAAGTFQSELPGCTSDWAPDCLDSGLTDPDADGVYTWQTTAIPAGSWQTRIAINARWTESYGAGGDPDGANIDFTVPPGGATVAFSYVRATHLLTVTVTP